MKLSHLMAVLVSLSAPLAAQDGPTVDRLEAAYLGWLDTHDVKHGTLAIRYKGAPVRVVTKGQASDAPLPMASVGKAITALCAFVLVREGKLSWDDKVFDHLGRGPEASLVADLVTHQSGIGPDSTQVTMPKWLNDKTHRARDVLDAVDGRPLISAPGTYAYNNENYALLGLVIEAASGASYRQACGPRVFTPAGVPVPTPARGEAFLPWGGWAMPVDDFAAVHAFWFGPSGAVGKDPFALPHADMGRGAYYGMGTLFREFRGGHNFWHFGLLCFPLRFNAGSFAVNWMGEWSAVAGFDACRDWDALFALDGALAGAVFQR